MGRFGFDDSRVGFEGTCGHMLMLRCADPAHEPEGDVGCDAAKWLSTSAFLKAAPRGMSCDSTRPPWSGCRAFTATSQLRTVSELYHETGVGLHDSWTERSTLSADRIGEGWLLLSQTRTLCRCAVTGPSLARTRKKGPRLTTAGIGGCRSGVFPRRPLYAPDGALVSWHDG